jgi:hypothetical protein
MKQRHLVGYDYGMGGLWSYVLADSAEAIPGPYPELTVVEKRPDRMSAEREASLEVDDVDAPDASGLLRLVVAQRSHP